MSKGLILIQAGEEWTELRNRLTAMVAAQVEDDFKAFPNATGKGMARVYAKFAADLILDELQPMVRGYIADRLSNEERKW